jgi:integrase
MAADNLSRLRVVPIPGADTGPVTRLLADLPPQWRGDTIGPDIVDWTARNGRGRMTALRLHRLPERLRVELAWMAHWQYLDGVGVHVAGINQIAAVLAGATDAKRAVPASLRDLDFSAASRMVSVWFEARHQRLPAPVSLRNLRLLFGYPRLALTARLHEGRWWEMDTWYPRCDPRIPLREREPCAGVGCAPGAIAVPVRAVAQLMAFVLDNHEDYRRRFGPSPWDTLTEGHPALWSRQITRERPARRLDETHYVDDHALAQITAHLAALAAPKHETVTVTLGGTHKQTAGWGAPQAMRMLLLQILTGRRLSEICLTDFDCLSPATGRAVEVAEQERIARFRYGQSKIDQAPDTILVDAEVVAVIAEQQQWVREQFPGLAPPRYLFPRPNANACGTKPYARQSYIRLLQRFSESAQITDSAGKPVHLNHTHRFRHTRLTRLAELGMPVHVLQRYAGHANPTMSMHYVAQREEHAEQAFLATRKFKADGTQVAFSRQDHDGMHLFDRADRFLPNGYCLLPPLQSCDKGNACLTCGVFVTDTSHLNTLNQQLTQTTALIERTTAQFQDRHGKPMPDDNVWLTHRTAERDALLRLLATMQATPGRAVQGAGTPTGPTPSRHRPDPPPEDPAMTDARQQRIDTLTNAARRKSEEKAKAADAAIRTLTKRGEPITFQAVQREAGVSHSFLYTHTALRERIEHLRRQNQPAPRTRPDQDNENNLVLAITTEVTRLKKQFRQQTQALRDALAQAHGENLDLRRELARRGGATQPPTDAR